MREPTRLATGVARGPCAARTENKSIVGALHRARIINKQRLFGRRYTPEGNAAVIPWHAQQTEVAGSKRTPFCEPSDGDGIQEG